MPEAARARMDHHGHLPRPNAECARSALVEDFVDHLDLEEVVARSECAELTAAAIERLGRYGGWIGARNAPLGLEAADVLSVSPTTLDCPRRAPFEHATQIARS